MNTALVRNDSDWRVLRRVVHAACRERAGAEGNVDTTPLERPFAWPVVVVWQVAQRFTGARLVAYLQAAVIEPGAFEGAADVAANRVLINGEVADVLTQACEAAESRASRRSTISCVHNGDSVHYELLPESGRERALRHLRDAPPPASELFRALRTEPADAPVQRPYWQNDETWTTADGRVLGIAALDLDHAQNIRQYLLRMTPSPGVNIMSSPLMAALERRIRELQRPPRPEPPRAPVVGDIIQMIGDDADGAIGWPDGTLVRVVRIGSDGMDSVDARAVWPLSVIENLHRNEWAVAGLPGHGLTWRYPTNDAGGPNAVMRAYIEHTQVEAYNVLMGRAHDDAPVGEPEAVGILRDLGYGVRWTSVRSRWEVESAANLVPVSAEMMRDTATWMDRAWVRGLLGPAMSTDEPSAAELALDEEPRPAIPAEAAAMQMAERSLAASRCHNPMRVTSWSSTHDLAPIACGMCPGCRPDEDRPL